MLHTQKKTTGFKHNLIHSVDGCGLWLRCRDGVEQWVEEQCQERPVGIISVGHWIRRGGGGGMRERLESNTSNALYRSHTLPQRCVYGLLTSHTALQYNDALMIFISTF